MNISTVKKIKTIWLYVSFAFLSIAVLFLIFIILGLIPQFTFFKESLEVFYWISICSATICLCILPVMSYYNSLQQKLDSQGRDELSNTAKALDDFAELVHSKEFSFSRNTVTTFYRTLGIGQLTQRFHDYASNDVYFDFIDCAVKNAINAKSKKDGQSADDWGDCLIESVEKCWHLYSLNKDLEEIPVFKKIDKFCSSILYVCNKLEIIAYNIMEARINEKTYREELFGPIDRVYSEYYYFLVKLGSDDCFPKLDASCRLFSKEDSDAK